MVAICHSWMICLSGLTFKNQTFYMSVWNVSFSHAFIPLWWPITNELSPYLKLYFQFLALTICPHYGRGRRGAHAGHDPCTFCFSALCPSHFIQLFIFNVTRLSERVFFYFKRTMMRRPPSTRCFVVLTLSHTVGSGQQALIELVILYSKPTNKLPLQNKPHNLNQMTTWEPQSLIQWETLIVID